MKVRELVAILQGFDQDLDAEYMDTEWGPSEVYHVEVYDWDDVPKRVVIE